MQLSPEGQGQGLAAQRAPAAAGTPGVIAGAPVPSPVVAGARVLEAAPCMSPAGPHGPLPSGREHLSLNPTQVPSGLAPWPLTCDAACDYLPLGQTAGCQGQGAAGSRENRAEASSGTAPSGFGERLVSRDLSVPLCAPHRGPARPRPRQPPAGGRPRHSVPGRWRPGHCAPAPAGTAHTVTCCRCLCTRSHRTALVLRWAQLLSSSVCAALSTWNPCP